MSSDAPTEAWARIDTSGVTLGGTLTKETVPRLFSQLERQAPSVSAALDLAQVTELDSAGIAFVLELAARLDSPPDHDPAFGLEEPHRGRLLAFQAAPPAGFVSSAPSPPDSSIWNRWLESLGRHGLRHVAEARDFLFLTSNVFTFGCAALLGRGRARKGTFSRVAVAMGVDAMPVVLLIAFLVGLVMALQAAAQLRRFGANIYIVDLVGISMTREMGALMTAIVLAGRSGSAIAAEVATMVVTEETDALRSLGLDPIRFVVVPRFLALMLVTPLLTFLATGIGIFGGFVAAIGYLDLAPQVFATELIAAVEPRDLVASLAKSVVFAWVIALLGSHQGFKVKGGAEGVGRATTAAVVTSIFAVIIVDAAAGMLLYFE